MNRRDKKIDRLKKSVDRLPVDEILHDLANIGFAPSIIYDDNGNWAVISSEFSLVRMKDTDDYTTTIFIKAEEFKPTIREAIKKYINDL